jgi:hypothetical protein
MSKEAALWEALSWMIIIGCRRCLVDDKGGIDTGGRERLRAGSSL